MSAGAFVISTYNSQYGGVATSHPIRVQPETLAATIGGTANAPGIVADTNPISAQVTKSKRGLGLHARTISAKILGAPPDTYSPNSVIRIPILTVELFDTIIYGDILTYLGTTWTVTGTSPEKVR